MKELSIAVVGIGGYGGTYVNALLDVAAGQAVRFVGAIDPAPERCARIDELRSRNVPIYPSLEAFYAQASADLVVVSSPIHLHRPQSIMALEHGSHVLCEKPLCATPEDIAPMIAARDRAGRLVAIGYQWSFAPAIQALKRDVMSGALGAPKRLRALVLWPRTEQYYTRNGWAGALKDPAGNWVLDSPVNNATAHYLHNMLYVLGETIDRSAMPARVDAELFRANAISNYDTAVLRIATARGAEVVFCTTHAVGRQQNPIFSYEFERAVVRHDRHGDGAIVAEFDDGSTRNYGSPDGPQAQKLWDVAECIRSGRPVVCGIEAASAQTACMWAAQQCGVRDFPRELVRVEGELGKRLTRVEGLEEAMTACYEQGRLPSELGLSWANPVGASVR